MEKLRLWANLPLKFNEEGFVIGTPYILNGHIERTLNF